MDRFWTRLSNKRDGVVAPTGVAPVVPVARAVPVVPVVPVAPRRTINPLFPLLCLGLILFLIASTIVLSLIPVYLTSRDINRQNLPSAQFSTNLLLRNGYLPAGQLTADNCARIQNQVRQTAAANTNTQGSVPSVTSCTVTGNGTQTGGRKRRQAQPVGNVINLVIVVPPGNCRTTACVLRRAQALSSLLLGLGNINIVLLLANGTSYTFVAAFLSASSITLVPASTGTATSAPGTATSTTTASPLQTVFYGVTNDSRLLSFVAGNPGTVVSTASITNLNPGDIITNIDFRPATGQLYGTSNSQLYIINEDTGVAHPIGAQMDTSMGTIAGMEFDPVYDVLRYVTSLGINLSIDPEEGNLYYDPNRPNTTTSGLSLANSNNVAGATSTALFILNPNTDALNRIDQQNNGNVTQVGSGLGVAFDSGIGFDISSTGVAIACVQIGKSIVCYLVDVNSGTFSQRLGEVTQPILSLAIPTALVAYAVLSNNNTLVFVNYLNSAFQLTSEPITGLQPNESFVAIDMRPFNGQLFGVTNASRLYLFNMGTAVVYLIGNGSPFSPPIRGTNFAIDFNPVVDRLRLVTDQGQNIVINQNTGLVQSNDTDINPSNISITSIAYANNVANASSTTLYDISPSLNQIFTQNPPASGTLQLVGPLGITIQTANGFDIGSKSGNALGLFTVNGVTSIYTINLNTGAATLLFNNVASSNIISYALGLNV